MTTVALPPAFTGTPEQILTDILATYEKRVVGYIAAHLARQDWQLAEDLTQDTFVHLWRYHISRGVPLDERVFGLLTRIARQMICHHLRRMRSHEVALDFTDPRIRVARMMAASPIDVPHLAGLYAELEEAKSRLAEAARRYRAAAGDDAMARRSVSNAVRPEAVGRCAARAAATSATLSVRLAEFSAAAMRVARARAAWNAAAQECTALAGAR
ncbi:RNA polymerase sigma factor [Kitasatospora sp. NPDC058162]|uniref:RNA polymerase sigma factor n=1 Tax=Kitasatospora sp. NPDC058162 TaxID=3346362 RepID=UPI0036D8B6E1